MKRLSTVLSILVVAVLMITGCGSKTEKAETMPGVTAEREIAKRVKEKPAPLQEQKKEVPPSERKVARTENTDGEISRTADFELEDINGRKFKLSDYSGNVIILNFFATWCPPCKAEMPDFNEITREYANDVTIIAINVGKEPLSKVRSFVEANKLRFKVAMDNGYVSRLYGPIRAIPVTYVIDRNFNIARKYLGARTKEVFVKDINELL